MMKRFLLFLLIIVFFPSHSLRSASAVAPLPVGLQEWMAAFQADYLNADPTVLKPIIPVPGWPVYVGGSWSYQYPPNWTVLGGDIFSLMVCDQRQLSCLDFVELQTFNQALTHDQLGVYVLRRVAGSSPYKVLGTFQKNIFPQMMAQPPSGIAQVWFVLWQHPQAGTMFTLVQAAILSVFSGWGTGNTSANWYTFTAPAEEFTATWQSTFLPMFFSSTYTLPGQSKGDRDRDGDGYSDNFDNYPDDLSRH